MKRKLFPLMFAACITLGGLIFFLPATLSQSTNTNLNNYHNCPMKGSTNTSCLQELNKLKNRWKAAPTAGQINDAITLAAILAPGDDENRWSTDDGAEVTGYVRSVTGTGAESCNCDSTTQKYQDIHIDLVVSESVANGANPGCKSFIVEITPRWKKLKGFTLAKAKKLEGKFVKFRGWMFFDRFHLKESFNTRNSTAFTCKGPTGDFACGAQGNDIWRATSWELHPVTSYQVVPAP